MDHGPVINTAYINHDFPGSLTSLHPLQEQIIPPDPNLPAPSLATIHVRCYNLFTDTIPPLNQTFLLLTRRVSGAATGKLSPCVPLSNGESQIRLYSPVAGSMSCLFLGLEDAIEILEYVVGTREEKLGTANPEV
ncbi:hypothetical protein Bca4012_037037 [Brassica carinata]